MTDLYAHLSIPRDAPHAAIRRAYRRRAALDHPDSPTGSTVKFALTKLAHDILTDPDRRARYDSTGDTTEAAPDNRTAQTLEIIAALLNQTLDNCAKHGADPLTINLAREIESLAANSIREFAKQRAQIAAHLPLAERLLGRFKRRANRKPQAKHDQNMLEAIAQSRVTGIKGALIALDTKTELFREAIAVISDYDFTADPARQHVHVMMFSGGGSGTGTGAW